MTPKFECPETLVRDVLSKGQIHWIKQERELYSKVHLVCLVNNEGSFGGYFPINAGLPQGLKPNILENGKLDTMPIVTGG
jgi:hypothetical protein